MNSNQSSTTKSTTASSVCTERRKTIPPRPDRPLNILKFLKNTLGKELTRLSVPVEFNEPLSMLQRVLEGLEFSWILDRAARENDPELQACLVALYLFGCFMRISDRIKKPFNPFLGETYELDLWDEEEGFRAVVEQVKHHPPTSAYQVESKNGWTLEATVCATSIFTLRKMGVDIQSEGASMVTFKNTGITYSMGRPDTYLNLLKGAKLVVYGSQRISTISKESPHDPKKPIVEYCYGAPKTSFFTSANAKAIIGESKNYRICSENYSVAAEIRRKSDDSVVLDWHRENFSGESEREKNTHALAHFQLFLNQPVEDCCPTDSRFRPDQRAMEMGDYDEAEALKTILENKQRARRSKPGKNLSPMWFAPNPAFPEKIENQNQPEWLLSRDYYAAKKEGWKPDSIKADFEARGNALYKFNYKDVDEYETEFEANLNASLNNNDSESSISASSSVSSIEANSSSNNSKQLKPQEYLINDKNEVMHTTIQEYCQSNLYKFVQ